ncbi:radical SAM/SPASM domain-containing protein [Paenibacillus maysiensis]|uniref:radical SAM/SPASM domain-containing protein n=1 Tax=Paenibacillus maysiensis TaxID=1155954 RepID=UPI000472E1E8|nr:radical SAM protein [Paenibacillus maysiensis]
MRKKPELLYLHMDVTVKCNLKCKHCFYADYNNTESISQELELDRMYELVDEAKSMGCQKIIFSGGEVFTSKKFFPLLRYCKLNNLKTIFITNATLINDDNLAELVELKDNIDEIKISYEGVNNDFIRGKGTGDIIINNILKLNKLGFRWTINTIINKFNLNELDLIYDFMKAHKPFAWRLDLPFNIGRYREYSDQLKVDDFESIFIKLASILKKYLDEKPDFELWMFSLYRPGLEDFDFEEKKLNMHPCSYNKRNLGIRGLGEVTPCSRFLPINLGNVRNDSIREAKNGKLFKDYWKLKISDIKDCVDCRYLKICGAGCRANAFENFGDIYRRDPLNCAVLPMFEKHIIPLFSKETQENFKELTTL